jgi:putative ABC transport system permease protein
VNFTAIKMVTGIRATYPGLIVAISFACPLMVYRPSIFAGLMLRTTNQVPDVRDAQAG